MMIWLVFGFLTAAVMAILLIPVLRRPPAEAAASRSDYDRTVFRDQLAELDRDVARGTIAPAEADAARNEISRRLLAAAAVVDRPPPPRMPAIAIIAVLLVPAIALPLYLGRGHPALPDVPSAARLADAVANQDMDALIAKVEAHLAANPGDLAGWRVLAPTYKKIERWDDAARAYARILDLGGPDAATIADYGEMVVYANQGMVTAEAARAFGQALKLDPQLPKARFFNALGLKQEGKRDAARAALTAFLADTPAGAPWRGALEAELKDIDSRAPALSQDQMVAGASMKASDRDAMIATMVDGLEAKLKADGNNLEGWQRLIRARVVLGQVGKAKLAYDAAKEQFKDRPEALTSLDGLARELMIE